MDPSQASGRRLLPEGGSQPLPPALPPSLLPAPVLRLSFLAGAGGVGGQGFNSSPPIPNGV